MLPALFVSLCVLFRILPHPYNFAPVGAVAIFAGRTLKPWAAFILVALAMAITDTALARLQGHPTFDTVTPFVYSGYFLQSLIGRRLRSIKGGSVAAAFLGSAVFFGLSNFGVWLVSGMYPHSIRGFTACYAAALPFLAGTVTGDVFWVLVLSLAYRPLASRLGISRFWVPVPAQELAIA